SDREYEAARLDIVRDVTKSYAKAVAARRAVDIEADRLRLADGGLWGGGERVQGGKEPLGPGRRGEVTPSRGQLAIDKARREAEIDRRALATLLGQERVEIVPDNRWFEAIGAVPAAAHPAGSGAVAANPDLARLDAQIARSRAGLEVERADAV